MSDTPGSEGAGGGEGGGEGGGAINWMDTLPDDLKGDATISRFAGKPVDELARAFVETKRLVGADKIILPKGDEDADGWNAAFKALGRPDDPAEYKFDVPEGQSNPLVDAFRPKAHELGLNQRQVTALDQFMSEQAQAAFDKQAADSAAAVETLKGELGAGWAETERHAKAAAKAFGVTEEVADKICEKLGDAEAIKLFANIGKRMGEGTFEGGDPADPLVGSDPVKTKEQLTNDADFRAKLNSGDPQAKARWDAVLAAISARQQAA